MPYHSHDLFNEDFHLNEKYFKNKRCGTFVELGAFDGVTFSNSLFYEEELGWRGHLIEPLPEEFAKLVENRPLAECYNYSIELEEGPVTFLDKGVYSTSHDDVHAGAMKYLQGAKIIQVNGIPFNKIIDAKRVPKIDFFSIDVEDQEYKIFQTFCWDIQVGLFCIEMHDYNEPKNQICRDLMTQHGYVYSENVAINEIWIDPNEYSVS